MAQQDLNSGLMVQPLIFITTLETVLGLLSLLFSSPLLSSVCLPSSPLEKLSWTLELLFYCLSDISGSPNFSPTFFLSSKCTLTFIAS